MVMGYSSSYTLKLILVSYSLIIEFLILQYFSYPNYWLLHLRSGG